MKESGRPTCWRDASTQTHNPSQRLQRLTTRLVMCHSRRVLGSMFSLCWSPSFIPPSKDPQGSGWNLEIWSVSSAVRPHTREFADCRLWVEGEILAKTELHLWLSGSWKLSRVRRPVGFFRPGVGPVPGEGLGRGLIHRVPELVSVTGRHSYICLPQTPGSDQCRFHTCISLDPLDWD